MEWGGNGEGEVSLQATWDQGGQGSHHTERREFQVSNGDLEQGELSRGVSRGNWQGELAGGCAICLALSSCIYIYYAVV
jgi:hypothetical protein